MIRSDDYRKLDGTDRGGGEVVGLPELDVLDALVDAFAAEMKAKLKKKCLEGYGGWDDPACKPGLEYILRDHVKRGEGQRVDVANIAAMLWNIERDSKA